MRAFLNNLDKIRVGLRKKSCSIILCEDPMTLKVVDALWRDGLISGYRIKSFRGLETSKTSLEMVFKSTLGSSLIRQLSVAPLGCKEISLSCRDISKLQLKTTTVVLSTTKGVLTGRECLKFRLGGNLLCMLS